MGPVSRIILGISGGIAAYKMPQLIRLFQQNGVEVICVLTPNTNGLVGEEALKVISKNQVYTNDRMATHDMAHIELAKWAQYLLVCPATANTMAKIAHGIADNLLTTLALSFENRLIIAPAMNTAMWNNAATKENIATLVSHGAQVLPVDSGELACGDTGAGKLLPLQDIVDHVLSIASPKLLKGKKILISSGPTQEQIDDVRILTNRSSGKMGAALAKAAMLAGADVTVVSGPSHHALPAGCSVIPVASTQDMKTAMEKEFSSCDVCIMAAAVCDFRPKEVITGKKHRDTSNTWSIDCIANPDIAALLGKQKAKQFLACFSLETDKNSDRPSQKLVSKNCDMMIVNTVDAALETNTTSFTIMTKDKQQTAIDTMEKKHAATIIMKSIALRLGDHNV